MGIRHSEETDALFRSVLALGSVEECYSYFEDLCTVREVRDLSQRLEVARLLDGGCSYQQAAAATGAEEVTSTPPLTGTARGAAALPSPEARR